MPEQEALNNVVGNYNTVRTEGENKIRLEKRKKSKVNNRNKPSNVSKGQLAG
jgi:hypothetical protein